MNNIKIAFCFDENLCNQVCVSIASLLKFSQKTGSHYDIYCICTKEATKIQDKLFSILKQFDSLSNLTMLPVQNQFCKGYETREITNGAYLRLQLHNFLPEINKIIYCDVDVLFQDSLKEIWETDIGNHYFLGVKGAVNFDKYWNNNLVRYPYFNELKQGAYINSGVVVMNLEKIRQSDIDKQWASMVTKKFFYLDQDIINLTCEDKISFIPLRYNVPAYLSDNELRNFVNTKLYSKDIVETAINHPAIIHYAGEKPWNNPNIEKGKIWYDFVKSNNILRQLFSTLVKERENKFMLKNLQNIFSVKNVESNLKKYKQITIMGIKIKIKKGYVEVSRPVLPRLEVHIVDHCNLNCRGCTHFCNVAPEKFLKLDDFERDLREISKKIEFNEIKLLGGEPLLHPELPKFLDKAREIFPDTKILLTSNLILLDTMKEDFWQAMKRNNICFQFTKYPPLNDKFVHYLDLLAKHEVVLDNIHVANEFWLMRNPSGDSNPSVMYKSCCDAYCRQLRDGRVYICPDACYMDYYNKYFDKNIPVDKGIEIYNHTGEELYKYLTSPKETCKFCMEKKIVPWSQSKREADEWNAI